MSNKAGKTAGGENALRDAAAHWIGEAAPETWPCTHLKENGLESLFFQSIPFKGQTTRVFAWLGLPEGASPARPAPGVVLVHGGGGTAFARWVRWWNRRGYAALAMDTCGAMPLPGSDTPDSATWLRHPQAGPPGWGGFDQVAWPVEDQWGTHACAAVIKAHTLLAARPEVEASRIGITGLSWGGYLTCLVVGLDPRFKAAAPVYGCGYVSEESTWTETGMFDGMTDAQVAFWRATFDPARLLPQAVLPMLWVNGTNDFAFWPSAWQRSVDASGGARQLCMKLRLPHGHLPEAEEGREVAAFFDAHLAGGAPMLRIGPPRMEGVCMTAGYGDERPLRSATLIVTPDGGRWPGREWHALPAAIDAASRRVLATVPSQATAAFFSLLTEDWLTTTSDIVFY